MDDSLAPCVDQYLSRFGWKILDRDTLIGLARARFDRDTTREEGPATRAAILCTYSAALYRACAGDEGRARQDQGYTELTAFLALRARRYSAVCSDATQRALEQIYRRFERCRQPETFLAFALQHLRDATRKELSSLQRAARNLSLDAEAPVSVMQRTPSDPSEIVIQNDLRRQLAAGVQRCIVQHPRAVTQLLTLWWTYIDELDDPTIAQRLRRTTAAVQVLRSRGLSRLRGDRSWQHLMRELGMLPVRLQDDNMRMTTTTD